MRGDQLSQVITLTDDCRRDAERKAHEMALLVADLQRMREHTARDAEEEAQMSRYQRSLR